MRMPDLEVGRGCRAETIGSDQVHAEQTDPLIPPLATCIVLVDQYMSRKGETLALQFLFAVFQCLAQNCALTIGVFALVLVHQEVALHHTVADDGHVVQLWLPAAFPGF